jgi:hypothetical protein
MLQIHAESQQGYTGQADGRQDAPWRRVKKRQNKVQDQIQSKICALLGGAVRLLVGIHFAREVPGQSHAALPGPGKPNKIQPMGSVLSPIFFKQRFLNGTHRQLYQAGQRG